MQPHTPAADLEQTADQAHKLPELPLALLACILQFIPQRERLSSCATACKSLAAAAAAATVSVDVWRGFPAAPERMAAFEQWLEKYAGQLVSLRVSGAGYRSTFHVPFCKLQQLTSLDLNSLEVHANPAADSSSSSSSSTGAAPKLQKLKLQDCTLSRSTILHLARLSGVTHLDIDMYRKNHHSPWDEEVKPLLTGLPNLERLKLAVNVAFPAPMPALPAHSLTALSLYRVSLPASASCLVNLRELALTVVPDLGELASLTMLTKLQLDCCKLADEDGASGFLAAVRGMHQLQDLALYGAREMLRGAEPHACAALTASGELTYLEVSTSYASPLPATALQHMFPAGRQLPLLQHLVFSFDQCQWYDEDCITAAELSSLVGACPALTHLELTRVLAADADLIALLQLPQQCQHLGVGGPAFGDRAAGVLAHLTQLTALRWARDGITGAADLTYAGLAQLTALHALDILFIEEKGSSIDCHEPLYVCDKVLLKTEAGGQSVSQQLRGWL